MKLVSRFKDYYDPVGKTDREERPLYVRETSDPIELIHDDELQRACHRARAVLGLMPAPLWPGDTAVIGFCGRAYPVLMLTVPSRSATTPTRVHAYDLDSYERALRERADGEGGVAFRDALQQLESRARYGYGLTRRSWARFQHDAELDLGDEPFRALGAPVFVLSGGRQDVVVTNPRLSSYDFASQVDPYTAWQTIDVYLGNNLSDLREVDVVVDDELKRHYHGYDEWSFKKRPGTGKKKR